MNNQARSSTEDRTYCQIETDFHEAEKRLGERLVEQLGVKRDALRRADDPDLRMMANCFAEHAITNRELGKRNSELEDQLHGSESRSELAKAQIARAAAARASIARAAIRELQKLMPAAIAQAKKGKPALLRMILRATR